MHEHILIIGGTGMLKATSIALADRCNLLTSVARTERSLNALDQALARPGVFHHLLPLDWTEPATFLDLLVRHLNRVGQPSLVLAWLHQDEFGPRIAAALAPRCGTGDFFQVRGSAAADPTSNAESLFEANTVPTCMRFHQIILGFHFTGNHSRWLNDAEISAGVLAAIDHPKDKTIIGTVTPWSAHP